MKYAYRLEYTAEIGRSIEHLSRYDIMMLFSSKKKCLYDIECQRAWHIKNADKFHIKDVSAISEIGFSELKGETNDGVFYNQKQTKQWVYSYTITFLRGSKKTFYGYITRYTVH